MKRKDILVLILVLSAITTTFASLSIINLLNPANLNFVTGLVTGQANVTIPSTVAISLPVDTIDFGNLDLDASNDTADNSPPPITVRNDGNKNVNITIGATDLFTGTDGANPSYFYQYKSQEKEAGSTVNGASDLRNTSWVDMSTFGAPISFANNTRFPTAFDELELEINVTVPNDEPPGEKSSTITLTASQA